jgi:hypothetical protein
MAEKKKKPNPSQIIVPGDFIRAGRHLRKTYVPACDNISSAARLARSHRRGELPDVESCSLLQLLQVPSCTNNQELLHLHLFVLKDSGRISHTPLNRTIPHLRNSPQRCVDHQHVPDGPPPVTSPESERCARAWGSPISSSSLFTAASHELQEEKNHNIESYSTKSYKELSMASVRWLVFQLFAYRCRRKPCRDCLEWVWGTTIKVLSSVA